MTVAALIVAGRRDAGEPAVAEVRRIAESAWAGGAWPLRIVATAAAPAVLGAVTDATPAERAPTGHRTIAAASAGLLRSVRGTSAVLLWPADHPWVDPETVTLLLQAHGAWPDAVVRAEDATPGVPVLVPIAHARTAPEAPRAEDLPVLLARLSGAGVRIVGIPVGDAGTTHDRTHDRGRLPPYRGPDRPLTEPPDWGAATAEVADDPAPLPRSRRTRRR